MCGTETNCCLTDERKYSRTDSSPFASLHNYIITYLGWSLAWWFWLLAVILLVLSSVFPSDWRLKDFLSCLLISDAIENFPDERLCDLIMTLNIICLLLVFTSVLSDSLRNRSRKWENKSTRELFTDRQKRYCTGLHFNGFPSVPPSLWGIDQRWLDIEKSYRWNYIHLNNLGANRFSIVLFIVLWNVGLRFKGILCQFFFLKGETMKENWL